MSLLDYYRLVVGRVGPAVESFTGISVPEYDSALVKSFGTLGYIFESDRFPSGSIYRYLVYLRHHGFPSPLMDWSYSPYVAAFFAFRDEPNRDADELRSIFAYCEIPNSVKGGALGEPTLRALGPYVKGHPRHFRQQSSYTICESSDEQTSWRFDSHQSVFDNARLGQDLLWRFDLPGTERKKVLQLLDNHNLNAFSLFDSQETLLETLWLREQTLALP